MAGTANYQFDKLLSIFQQLHINMISKLMKLLQKYFESFQTVNNRIIIFFIAILYVSFRLPIYL